MPQSPSAYPLPVQPSPISAHRYVVPLPSPKPEPKPTHHHRKPSTHSNHHTRKFLAQLMECLQVLYFPIPKVGGCDPDRLPESWACDTSAGRLPPRALGFPLPRCAFCIRLPSL